MSTFAREQQRSLMLWRTSLRGQLPKSPPPFDLHKVVVSLLIGLIGLLNLVVKRTALAMIHLATSQITIGLTPGHLSKAIRQHAIRRGKSLRSMKVVQSHLACRARA